LEDLISDDDKDCAVDDKDVDKDRDGTKVDGPKDTITQDKRQKGTKEYSKCKLSVTATGVVTLSMMLMLLSVALKKMWQLSPLIERDAYERFLFIRHYMKVASDTWSGYLGFLFLGRFWYRSLQ
jgi:hypothetical protein